MRAEGGQQGQSLLQLIIVVAIMMILAALAVPNINRAIQAERLRTSAGDLASMMQNARLQASRTNTVVPIYLGTCCPPATYTANGVPIAFADLNGDGAWEALNAQGQAEPVKYFSTSVFPTLAAPPANYVLVGDTGGAFPAGTTLAFSPRGLPCAYNAGPPVTCATPAPQYFTYYITNNQPTPGWAVVVVTKGGRTKVQMWNGAAWGN